MGCMSEIWVPLKYDGQHVKKLKAGGGGMDTLLSEQPLMIMIIIVGTVMRSS